MSVLTNTIKYKIIQTNTSSLKQIAFLKHYKMPAKKPVQKTTSTYVIDLSKPVKDKIIDIANFV